MKIQRKLMGFVVLCAMLAVFLAGCAETPEPPPEEISTITVVDHLGRTVELQKPAERVIVPGSPVSATKTWPMDCTIWLRRRSTRLRRSAKART